MKSIKFSVFADLHYKYGMYPSTIDDLKKILGRAKENNVDMVMHCGDFSNDYIGSPELLKEYLENDSGLKVYGVYGNHELESENNSMEYVTEKLTNDGTVVWGTEDGHIGDGNIGYYYFDLKGFRIICTDTNYSYNEEKACWEHNTTCSYGAPAGNIKINSLGSVQLEWLKKVLFDAAEKGLCCIVFGHVSFSGIWGSSPDTEAVREMFKSVNAIKKGTVLMAVNGHHHTNHVAESDGIVFFDVNAAINGEWIPKGYEHYFAEHTYMRSKYDENGALIEEKEVPLGDAWMSKNSWYFRDALNAIVTVEEDGHVIIDGMKTEWVYGILPDNKDLAPEILSREFKA